MSTYGSLTTREEQKQSTRHVDGKTIMFYYSEVIGNHYEYQDTVDAHNTKRHDCGTKQGLGLEQTWMTTRWPCHVFAFILDMTEVNAYLLMKYFSGFQGTQWEFRKKLAFEMVHNLWETEPNDRDEKEQRILRSEDQYELILAPIFSKWLDGGWKKVYKMGYQQHNCMAFGCKK